MPFGVNIIYYCIFGLGSADECILIKRMLAREECTTQECSLRYVMSSSSLAIGLPNEYA